MGKTALELSEKEWQAYRPASSIVEEPNPDRLNRAWSLARIAANLLRERFGATRVVVFGSLAHDEWFTRWSDIDGEHWHQLLLEHMASEIGGVRPAVISDATRQALDEYRGFRHVVRNVYTFLFNPAKMQRLVENAPDVLAQAQAELLAFASFVERQADSN